MHNRSYQLYGKHSQVIIATFKADDIIETINNSVAKVTKKMWILEPIVDLKSPNYLQMYLSYMDENKLRELSIQCSETLQYVSWRVGNIKGIIIQSIAEHNFSFFYNFLKKRKFIFGGWEDIKNIERKNIEPPAPDR